MNIQCVFNGFLRRLLGALLAALGVSLIFAAFFLLIGLLFSTVPGGQSFWAVAWLPLVILVGVIFAAQIFGAFVSAVQECSTAGAGGGAPGGAGQALLSSDLDCAGAQAARDQARNGLDAAERALREQEERVRQAQRRLRAAQSAVSAAAVAVALAILNPFGWGALASLIAALTVAAAFVARRAAQLGREMGRLTELALTVAAAQAKLAAAEAAVAALCPAGSSDTSGSIVGGKRPVGGVNVAILGT